MPQPSDPSETQLQRGHALTAKIREIEAEVSAWMGEVTAASPMLLDAQLHSSNALTALQRAQVELGVLTQVIAEALP